MNVMGKIVAGGIVACVFSSVALGQVRTYGPAEPYLHVGRSVSVPPFQVQDQENYDESGTRGRMGLGANPSHPEGPGNFSTPR
jgi:hypothetical protein